MSLCTQSCTLTFAHRIHGIAILCQSLPGILFDCNKVFFLEFNIVKKLMNTQIPFDLNYEFDLVALVGIIKSCQVFNKNVINCVIVV